MDMIVHQTVGPYLEGVLCRVFVEQFQIGLAILIIEKITERLLPRWVT